MIRNIAMVKLKPDTPPDKIERMITELQGLQIPGMSNLSVGTDAGLREGNFDLVIVVDLDDDAAYRVYDDDPEHNRIRRELLAPIAERVERIQYQI